MSTSFPLTAPQKGDLHQILNRLTLICYRPLLRQLLLLVGRTDPLIETIKKAEPKCKKELEVKKY